MTVFDAFPNAIIRNIWEMGKVQRGTLEGVKFKPVGFIDVIVDEGANGNLDTSPSAEGIASDTLVYARPEQVGCANIAKFVGGYYLHNAKTDTYYQIIDAAIAKNQHKGVIEHIEFKLRPTGVANVQA